MDPSKRVPTSIEIIAALDELRWLTVLDDGPRSFKAKAYGRAIAVLRDIPGALTDLTEAQLMRFPGIGKATAGKVHEYAHSGSLRKLRELRQKYPPGYQRLARLPGLGPRTLARLREELGVSDLPALQAALDSHAIRTLKGLGPGLEQTLARSYRFVVESGLDTKWPVAQALPAAQIIAADLRLLEGVTRVEVAGELRRMVPLVQKAQLVAAAQETGAIVDYFLPCPWRRVGPQKDRQRPF